MCEGGQSVSSALPSGSSACQTALVSTDRFAAWCSARLERGSSRRCRKDRSCRCRRCCRCRVPVPVTRAVQRTDGSSVVAVSASHTLCRSMDVRLRTSVHITPRRPQPSPSRLRCRCSIARRRKVRQRRPRLGPRFGFHQTCRDIICLDVSALSAPRRHTQLDLS
jgi:hypothetical protein